MLIEYECDNCKAPMSLDENSTNAHIKISHNLGIKHRCEGKDCNTVMYFTTILPATVHIKPNQPVNKELLKTFLSRQPTEEDLVGVTLMDKLSPRG